MKKKLTIRYYSFRGTQTESYETEVDTARQLLHEIEAGDSIQLTTHIVKAAINNEFVDWDTPIQDRDQVTFLPPFSGG